MFGHQGVALLEREWKVCLCLNRCGFGVGSVSLEVGFEASEAQARPSGSLFLLSRDLDVELSTSSAP